MSTNMFFFVGQNNVSGNALAILNVASVVNFVSNYVVPNDVAGLGTASDVISEDDWLYSWDVIWWR